MNPYRCQISMNLTISAENLIQIGSVISEIYVQVKSKVRGTFIYGGAFIRQNTEFKCCCGAAT